MSQYCFNLNCLKRPIPISPIKDNIPSTTTTINWVVSFSIKAIGIDKGNVRKDISPTINSVKIIYLFKFNFSVGIKLANVRIKWKAKIPKNISLDDKLEWRIIEIIIWIAHKTNKTRYRISIEASDGKNKEIPSKDKPIKIWKTPTGIEDSFAVKMSISKISSNNV